MIASTIAGVKVTQLQLILSQGLRRQGAFTEPARHAPWVAKIPCPADRPVPPIRIYALILRVIRSPKVAVLYAITRALITLLVCAETLWTIVPG